MQVKNISARGWWVMGTMISPGATETVEATVADIGDNPDLEIVDEVVEDHDPVDPAESAIEAETVTEESAATVEQEKRKPGRPAK